jgi:hypothetical protein
LIFSVHASEYSTLLRAIWTNCKPPRHRPKPWKKGTKGSKKRKGSEKKRQGQHQKSKTSTVIPKLETAQQKDAADSADAVAAAVA